MISSHQIEISIPDIFGTGMEVKQGSAASITCSVSNFRPSGVTVTWKDNPGIVTKTTDSSGPHDSVLTLKDVQSDSLHTCVVKSKEFPASEETQTIVSFKIYGNENLHRFYQML